MSRLVCGQVEIRRRCKAHMITGRKRARTEFAAGVRGGTADVRGRATHVVHTERSLDPIEVRKG